MKSQFDPYKPEHAEAIGIGQANEDIGEIKIQMKRDAHDKKAGKADGSSSESEAAYTHRVMIAASPAGYPRANPSDLYKSLSHNA